MLLDFRVSNFRSFKEKQTLSLVASKDPKHPGNLICLKKMNLLKSVAIFGSNASGKSNVIKAIRFMRWFISNSATSMTQGDNIPGISPFRLTAKTKNQPSTFIARFIVNKTLYEYGFSTTSEQVYDEWLFAYPVGRRQLWFERRFDPETKNTNWIFRGPLKSEKAILKSKTRSNGLVLARGAELNIKTLSEIFLWWSKNIWVFDLSKSPMILVQKTAGRAKEDVDFKKQIIQLIRHADFGIDDFKIGETQFAEDLPDEIRGLLTKEALSKFKGVQALTIKMAHTLSGSQVVEFFDIEDDESNGTQRFFAVVGPFLDALIEGALIVVDELECSMHPLLTRKLIELFQSPEANKKGAQLIFATHDSVLMDPVLFRRDQIWMTNKKNNGATELYSLYDINRGAKPRNTEAFQRNYLAGRYGGVPDFGPTFEDLELS